MLRIVVKNAFMKTERDKACGSPNNYSELFHYFFFYIKISVCDL